MTDSARQPDENDREILELAQAYFDVKCPRCGRFERFEEELMAHAWIVGHIQSEHEDELPRYEGVEGTDD